MTAGSAQEAPGPGDGGRVEKADDLVDRVTVSVAGVVARVVARTREEAEDIWAEAKSVHRGDHRDSG